MDNWEQTSTRAGAERLKRVHILHTNDLHSHFEQVPKLYTMITQIRDSLDAKGERTLLVDVGDHLDRARLETEGTDGWVNRAIIEKFNYDVITFGNNELLTFLPDQIAALYEQAPFKVVSSNVARNSSDQPDVDHWIQKSAIFKLDDVRVGVVGVTIPFETYYELMGWNLTSPMQAIKENIEHLRNKVDLLVVLSHVGITFDEMLAEQVPQIDVILGGHTHHLLETPLKIRNTWIAAAGVYGQHLGKITIELEEESKTVQKVTGWCQSVKDASPDQSVQSLIERYRKEAAQALSTPVKRLTEPLEISWEKESPLANLLADSLRDWVGTDAAIVNSGQLLSGLSSGMVTKKMLHQICPHPINPVAMTIKGDQLLQTLEESLLDSYFDKEIRGFGFRGKILGNLSISGLKVLYHPMAPPKKKIQSVYIGEEMLKIDKEYLIATIDMFTFGIGYPRLKNGKIIKTFMPEFLRDLLYNQIKKESSLDECKSKRWISIL